VAFYNGALVIIAQKAQIRTDHANEVAGAKHRKEVAQSQDDPAAEEHRSHRADPRSGRDDERPDRASPRGHLRRRFHQGRFRHVMIGAMPACWLSVRVMTSAVSGSFRRLGSSLYW